MGVPRLFRLPQHKQFHYEPIYYDERKERMEERIRQIEAEYGIKIQDRPVRTLNKGTFSHFYDRKRKVQRYSNTRLVIIIIFLLIISYFLFFT
jgi:hypothetical protein